EEYGYELLPNFENELYGVLESVTDALDGGVTRYAYQPMVIGVGGSTPADRRAVRELIEPEGGVTFFGYHLAGLAGRQESTTTTVTDRRGKDTFYVFNRYGGPLEITDPEGNVNTTTWSPDDIVMISRTDGKGTLTEFTYDEHGNLLSESVEVSDFDGVVHTYVVENTYVPAFAEPPYIKTLLASRRDRNGHLSELTYDEHGNLLSQSIQVSDPVSGPTILATEHAYATNGDRLSTTDARGNTSHFSYDAYGHLETVTNPLGHETRTEWNERSLPQREGDALGRETLIETDTLGRVIRRTLPDDLVEQVIYDDVANTRTQIDAEGRSTVTSFDLEGRVVRIDNAAGGTKVFAYDPEGTKTLESPWFDDDTPRDDTTFVYDDAGRLDHRTEPLGRITTYVHDGAGNVISETLSDADDPDFEPRITETDYDAMNRTITVRRRLGNEWVTSHMRPDGEGNKVLELDALGRETSHVYDELNRLLETAEPEGRVTRNAYDGNSNLIRSTLLNQPEDQVRELVYDQANRLITSVDAEGHSQSIEYDDVGNVLREIDARGHMVSHEYDERNRKRRTTVHLDAGDAVTEMDYDGVGNLTEQRQPNGNVVANVYDDLNRLTSTADSLGAVASFEYDVRSRRAAEIDARGHRTESIYDALDRLVRQDLPEERTLVFTYDAAGNLLTETDAR
ncbi:MAG: RHS repeat protein, partial [bacterium]|nr:RHS repeat protein [bacterium]